MMLICVCLFVRVFIDIFITEVCLCVLIGILVTEMSGC